MREITNEARSTTSAAYTFDDGSVVWVCFRPATAVNSDVYTMARRTAYRFLNNLNPVGRWEGKIDGSGKVLQSPINVSENL